MAIIVGPFALHSMIIQRLDDLTLEPLARSITKRVTRYLRRRLSSPVLPGEVILL